MILSQMDHTKLSSAVSVCALMLLQDLYVTSPADLMSSRGRCLCGTVCMNHVDRAVAGRSQINTHTHTDMKYKVVSR